MDLRTYNSLADGRWPGRQLDHGWRTHRTVPGGGTVGSGGSIISPRAMATCRVHLECIGGMYVAAKAGALDTAVHRDDRSTGQAIHQWVGRWLERGSRTCTRQHRQHDDRVLQSQKDINAMSSPSARSSRRLTSFTDFGSGPEDRAGV